MEYRDKSVQILGVVGQIWDKKKDGTGLVLLGVVE